MKIQLKRSNVLDGGVAKAPTASQMEYGELALNYSAIDPSVFIKDSSNNVIKIAGEGALGDEWVSDNNNLYPSNLSSTVLIGPSSPGTPAITLSSTGAGVFTGNVTLPGGGGDTQALQKQEVISLIGSEANNGQINVDAGNGLSAIGTNATANQSGNTTRTLAVQASNSSIIVASDGISLNPDVIPDTKVPTTANPPAGPIAGELWWDSDNGRLYVYYTDQDSSQWVDASPAASNPYWSRTGTTLTTTQAGDDVVTASQNGGQLAGFRNQIINGDFRIWQRGTTFSVNTFNSFTADRWGALTGPYDTTTLGISSASPLVFEYSISNTGADTGFLQQGIELYRAASNNQFYVGSEWTLSFWSTEDQTANAAIVKFKNGLLDETSTGIPVSSSLPNYVSTGEISNGFTRYKATFSVTANASVVSGANCLTPILVLSSGEKITGVQLEPGPVATPFELRPIGTELALCQRYYQDFSYAEDVSLLSIYQIDNANRVTNGFWPVHMRIPPTVTASIYSGKAITNSAFSDKTFWIAITEAATTGTSYYVETLTADAEL